MVAKVAGGIIGLGLIGTGSVAMAKPEWFGINKEVPWTPLSKDHSFSATGTNGYGTNTFGSKYKGVLTGVVGTDSESGAKNTNEDWWNKSFEQLKVDSLSSDKPTQPSDKFKYSDTKNESKVSKGISGTKEEKGLNQICNEAYKAQDSKITTAGDKSDEYKESDVWKYCSPIGSKPKTIKETNPTPSYGANTIGGTEGNKDKLVSITGNDKFWEIRDKEFKGIGKYQKIEEAEDTFFDLGKNKTIKELCEEAYKQTAATGNKSTSSSPTTAQALKYCSINKE